MERFPRDLEFLKESVLIYMLDNIDVFSYLFRKGTTKVLLERESKHLTPEEKSSLLTEAVLRGDTRLIKFMVEVLGFRLLQQDVGKIIIYDDVKIVDYLVKNGSMDIKEDHINYTKSVPMFLYVIELIDPSERFFFPSIQKLIRTADINFVQQLYDICPESERRWFFPVILTYNFTEERFNFVLDHLENEDIGLIGYIIVRELDLEHFLLFIERFSSKFNEVDILEFLKSADVWSKEDIFRYILDNLPISRESLLLYKPIQYEDILSSKVL